MGDPAASPEELQAQIRLLEKSLELAASQLEWHKESAAVTDRRQHLQIQALNAQLAEARAQWAATCTQLQELAASVARVGAALDEEAAAAGVSLPAARGMLRELHSAVEAAGAKLGSPPRPRGNQLFARLRMLPKAKDAAPNLEAPAAAGEQRQEQQAGAQPGAQLAAAAPADNAQHRAEASPAKPWQAAAARTLERAPLKTEQPQPALTLPAPPEGEGQQQQQAQGGGDLHMVAAAAAAAAPGQLPAVPRQGEEEALPHSPGSSSATSHGSTQQAGPAGLRSPGSVRQPRYSMDSGPGSPAGSGEDEEEAPPRGAESPLPPLELEVPLSPPSPAQVANGAAHPAAEGEQRAAMTPPLGPQEQHQQPDLTPQAAVVAAVAAAPGQQLLPSPQQDGEEVVPRSPASSGAASIRSSQQGSPPGSPLSHRHSSGSSSSSQQGSPPGSPLSHRHSGGSSSSSQQGSPLGSPLSHRHSSGSSSSSQQGSPPGSPPSPSSSSGASVPGRPAESLQSASSIGSSGGSSSSSDGEAEGQDGQLAPAAPSDEELLEGLKQLLVEHGPEVPPLAQLVTALQAKFGCNLAGRLEVLRQAHRAAVQAIVNDLFEEDSSGGEAAAVGVASTSEGEASSYRPGDRPGSPASVQQQGRGMPSPPGSPAESLGSYSPAPGSRGGGWLWEQDGPASQGASPVSARQPGHGTPSPPHSLAGSAHAYSPAPRSAASTGQRRGRQWRQQEQERDQEQQQQQQQQAGPWPLRLGLQFAPASPAAPSPADLRQAPVPAAAPLLNEVAAPESAHVEDETDGDLAEEQDEAAAAGAALPMAEQAASGRVGAEAAGAAGPRLSPAEAGVHDDAREAAPEGMGAAAEAAGEAGGPAEPPSDEVVVARLRQLLAEVDLATTTQKQLRRKLEAEYGCDLAYRKALLRAKIDPYLQAEEAEIDVAAADEEPFPQVEPAAGEHEAAGKLGAQLAAGGLVAGSTQVEAAGQGTVVAQLPAAAPRPSGKAEDAPAAEAAGGAAAMAEGTSVVAKGAAAAGAAAAVAAEAGEGAAAAGAAAAVAAEAGEGAAAAAAMTEGAAEEEGGAPAAAAAATPSGEVLEARLWELVDSDPTATEDQLLRQLEQGLDCSLQHRQKLVAGLIDHVMAAHQGSGKGEVVAQQAQQGRPGSRLPLEEVLRSLRTPADADGAQRPPLPYAGGPAMPLEEAASPGGADEGWFAEQGAEAEPAAAPQDQEMEVQQAPQVAGVAPAAAAAPTPAAAAAAPEPAPTPPPQQQAMEQPAAQAVAQLMGGQVVPPAGLPLAARLPQAVEAGAQPVPAAAPQQPTAQQPAAVPGSSGSGAAAGGSGDVAAALQQLEASLQQVVVASGTDCKAAQAAAKKPEPGSCYEERAAQIKTFPDMGDEVALVLRKSNNVKILDLTLLTGAGRPQTPKGDRLVKAAQRPFAAGFTLKLAREYVMDMLRLRLLCSMTLHIQVASLRWLCGVAGPQLDLHALCVRAPCSADTAAGSLSLFVRGKGGGAGQFTSYAGNSSMAPVLDEQNAEDRMLSLLKLAKTCCEKPQEEADEEADAAPVVEVCGREFGGVLTEIGTVVGRAMLTGSCEALLFDYGQAGLIEVCNAATLAADVVADLAARGGAALAAELQLAQEAKPLAATLERLAAARQSEAAAAAAAARQERQRKASKGKGKGKGK